MSAFSETDRRGYLWLEQGTLIEPLVCLCQRDHLSPRAEPAAWQGQRTSRVNGAPRGRLMGVIIKRSVGRECHDPGRSNSPPAHKGPILSL